MGRYTSPKSTMVATTRFLWFRLSATHPTLQSTTTHAYLRLQSDLEIFQLFAMPSIAPGSARQGFSSTCLIHRLMRMATARHTSRTTTLHRRSILQELL